MAKDNFAQVLEGLDNWAVQAMNANTLTGMALGVVKEGELVYAKGFGYANVAAEKPVTPQTVFQIASISKSFTAIGLMQLWEQGKFELDEPVNKYLKAYKVLHPDPAAPQVTFKHLLTHTAGIGETKDMRELIEQFYLKTNPYATRAGEPVISLKEYTGGLLKPDAYPDQKWAYANLGYATIGQLIEDISGIPFAQYMIKHVFDPLGMHTSDYVYSERVSAQMAQGYEFLKGRLHAAETLYLPRQGARSVHTTLADLGRYAAALMNGGENQYSRILKPETLEKMFTPHYRMDERFLFSMGLGLLYQPFRRDQSGWARWQYFWLLRKRDGCT
jgi:CubicO group peptidase (beta-lactamase class C family)